MTTTLALIAKAPVPGRVKTRLCPPLTPEQAARLARAALEDSLEAVRRASVDRRVLVLDGDVPRGLGAGLEVIRQRGAGLAERLAAAFDDLLATAAGPTVLIGMDTPQVAPGLLDDAIVALASDAADSVLGPATDGGYWAIGLATRDPAVFRDVPMSSVRTGAVQRQRLEERGDRVHLLPTLRDVDTYGDAEAVAADAPRTRFAAAFRDLALRMDVS